MATGGEFSPSEIAELAAAISSTSMETIAIRYLGLEPETLVSLRDEHRGNIEAFKRDIIQRWANMNSGPNQRQTFAGLLFQAAREGGYVNPTKVEEILKVSDKRSDIPTDDDFEELCEELKDYTEDAMKMENTPWIPDYLIQMEDLYTDLIIEKLENKPGTVVAIPLDNYQELFKVDHESGKNGNKGEIGKIAGRRIARRRKKPSRVLLKGDPGAGKTTLIKKMGWDWAKGFFTTFSIIFIVFLKFANPGEPIENIIIKSMPNLEGMDLSGTKLTALLDKHDIECLIILDGLDEHAMGQNQDVVKIIHGRKMRRCNVLVTSRPHSAIGIEKYFQTVVAVQGFNNVHAWKFALKFLTDPDDLRLALNLSFNRFSVSGETHNPILLSIICNLIQEGEVNPSNRNLSLGELYSRLVHCLYKKYTVRKGIEYKVENFLEMLRKLGQLAWKCLTSGNHLLVQKDIIREWGEDAFDYGLLIGHGGIRLRRDETADIFVSFIHRSIEEFLGSLQLMLRLRHGENMNSMLYADGRNSIIFQNPLLLHFCVWFLHQDQTFIHDTFGTSFCQMQGSFDSTFVDQIGLTQLDFGTLGLLYQSMNIFTLGRDQLLSEYVQHLVSQSRNVEELVLNEYIPLTWVAGIFQRIGRSQIKVIRIEGNYFTSLQLLEKAMSNLRSDELAFIVSDYNFNSDCLNKLRTFCVNIGTMHSLYIDLGTSGDELPGEISQYLSKNTKRLYLLNELPRCRPLTGYERIQPCRFLTHITLYGLHNLHESVLLALSEAVKSGNLARLTHLNLALCDRAVTGKLRTLFTCPWPTLSYLNLYGCRLDSTDLVILSGALETFLPSLNSLVLSTSVFTTAIATVFEHHCPRLTNLFLDGVSKQDYDELIEKIGNGASSGLVSLGISMDTVAGGTFAKPLNTLSLTQLTLNHVIFSTIDLYNVTKSRALTQLRKLDISNSTGFSGCLSILLCHSFPHLEVLNLSYCGLDVDDLRSLAKSSVKGRLPKLKFLDLSNNGSILAHLDSLFDYCCTWNDLHTLHLDQTTFDFSENESPRYAQLLNVLCFRVKAGNLSSLRKLRFTALESNYFSGEYRISWPQLQQLDIVPCEINNTMRLLENLAKAVELSFFPALKTVRFATIHFLPLFNPNCSSPADMTHALPEDPDPQVLHALRKRGIKVYFFNFAPDRFQVESDFM